MTRCSLLALVILPFDLAEIALPASPDARLPPGVKIVWDLDSAYREATPTRERVSLNGLWRWQPAENPAAPLPEEKWGYFKVPGCWPGISDYMQKDCQTVFVHDGWKNVPLGRISAAWYQREFELPAGWPDRRIALSAEYVNSLATVYVDGKKAGEIRYPGGECELTSVCHAGRKHVLSLLVEALPLEGVMLSFANTAQARQVKGSVARRGLCGDVFLVGTPQKARIADIKVDTSVRRGEITFDAAIQYLTPQQPFTLRARIKENGRQIAEFTSKAMTAADLREGRAAFTAKWKPERLWDLHTPKNMYDLELSLLDAAGNTLDTGFPVRFGFREFWIDGRDFYLNGTRVFLSAVPLDNAQVGAAWASYAGAKESLKRLQAFGINYVYTHNYGCEPGSHLSFAEILRAADDVGMLVGMSQPHFSHYAWKAPDADQANGYARHAEFYVRAAQNHPSVVAYAMSHNATGYNEDMNPDLIDGKNDPRDTWAANNVKLALRAEAIVRRLDPGRIVYHHASGNLGSMHASNFYVNFAPVQELSDWFGHWAAEGVKPMFTCEYGVPFTWDWTMYRGWYKGEREFGSARVPWEFCLAEWNAQFLGDRAFPISEPEKANLRWEARQFRQGSLWHRWDYPCEVGSPRLEERYPVFAMYLTDNWRAYRTWGLSANSPWEHGHYWKLRDGVDRGRKDLPVDWEHLQRPGFSPDCYDSRYERVDLAYSRTDWIATPAAEALLRNNRPLLAYLGGKPAAFTSKDHNFTAGETVEKQIIVINNSRQPVTADCQWSLALPQAVSGRQQARVETGQQERIPLKLTLPASLPPGAYQLNMAVKFSTGETQTDAFMIHVLPPAPVRPAASRAKIALYDPRGETGQWLRRLGVQCQPVRSGDDLSTCDVLILGKGALTLDGPVPSLTRVRQGLKVVVFEQTADVLEKRVGFRTTEYGLRQVFPRVPGHPLLAGLNAEQLRDWRGESTTLPPRLKYESRPRLGPTVQWCGISVPRVWRCGNRGNVASALIEKPARGDFLAILDGGYSLQYSPLLEYREGRGMVLFCQADVTGRTESDPAADRLACNVIGYVTTWKPTPTRPVRYVGEPEGKGHLEKSGLTVIAYDGGELPADCVLVVGPGTGRVLGDRAVKVRDWVSAGGHVLALGLNRDDAAAILPFPVTFKKSEYISTSFEAPAADSLLAGIGPADCHNRDPRELPLVVDGAKVLGNGVLAQAERANMVFCQLVPWHFDPAKPANVKRTYRRVSVLVSRLLSNLGVESSTPLLSRFSQPLAADKAESRWLDGLYLDTPEEWDDPYRFFRW